MAELDHYVVKLFNWDGSPEIKDWWQTFSRVYCHIYIFGGDLASTRVAKPEVHAEGQTTS
jgi:hypothetical protein